jgi:DNA-binding NarL/FixJ family response regulator
MLVDDHRLFREGLREILEEEGFPVVGEAESAAEAVSMAAERKPAVVLMDLEMPGGSGIEATRRLAERSPDSRVVVLTVSAEEADVVEAVQAGACGYLLKDASVAEIAAGVQAAVEGDSLLSPRVTADLLDRVREAPAPRPLPGEPKLTERERDVLRLVSQGRGNLEIAKELGISEQTVKTHVSSLLEKLGVHNRIQAAVYAVRNGLV